MKPHAAAQWLLAERISAHTPDILLLRPNLYRLEVALANLAAEGVHRHRAARGAGRNQQRRWMRIAGFNTVSLIELRDGYRLVVDGMTALDTLLETVNAATTCRIANCRFRHWNGP